ncbi:MAG: hypothetical protein KBD07_01570 [Candidatus Omnitrophica bacterium]|jgi:hypothetical protein|nr:hypothetical protein [Candidatus Omnitrophota bacterium]
MSEHLENGSSSAADHSEADVIAILKKIQQQMAFLEKKIDTLLGQQSSGSQGSQPSGERSFDRPSFKDRHFSKPTRSFGTRTEHYGRGDREGGRPSFGGDRPERGGFGQGRPSYGRPRRDDHRGGPGGGSGSGSGFGGPKKPFYQGRKERH